MYLILHLDVAYQNNLGELFHLQVGNNIKGFEKIMEHTGTALSFCNGSNRGLLHPVGFLFA